MFQGPGPYEQLSSEKVVVSAPMSFAGSTQRILIGTAKWHPAVRIPVLVVVLPLVWTIILCWYLFWGIWLIPYRLLRRSSRKTKKRELQHREMLNQMHYQAIATQHAVANASYANASPSAPGPAAIAAPGNPAAWHPDPTGRFAQRYWNGESWTAHVASADGSPSNDPMT